jgi:hypothetical protein
MSSENRKALLEQILHLAGTRERQWRGFGQEFRGLPDPTPEQATVEVLGRVALLTDDWNGDLEVAHKKLSEQTAKLTESTETLDVSPARLDRRTSNLTTATWLLIGATAVLIGATLFLAFTKFMGHS